MVNNELIEKYTTEEIKALNMFKKRSELSKILDACPNLNKKFKGKVSRLAQYIEKQLPKYNAD